MTTRHEFAEYCRKRQISKSDELSRIVGMTKTHFENLVKQSNDTDIIESYCQCAQCGAIWVSTKQVDDILSRSKSVEEAYYKLEHSGECDHR